ncbi:MAG: hypothetical protein K8I00_00940, partial [Candidatus Omnitrophica bacterium]|nr:hypothetical protein [Candidatus Omnitrophota bacterium]
MPHTAWNTPIILALFMAIIGSFQPSTSHAESQNNILVAEILIPPQGALVRGDVPVYGLAYGTDFREFRLEYGEGNDPQEWHLIQQSTAPQSNVQQLEQVNFSLGKTIPGNLGMWVTGLSEYEYAEYPVDLPMGDYSLRLTVEDIEGREVIHTTHLSVGRVILNCCASRIVSPDGMARLEIPEHILPDIAKVVSITALPKAPSSLTEMNNLKLVGKLYRIRPVGQLFLDSIELHVSPPSDWLGSKNKLQVCFYQPETKDWTCEKTSYLPKKNSYRTSIRSIPDRLAIAGLFSHGNFQTESSIEDGNLQKGVQTHTLVHNT